MVLTVLTLDEFRKRIKKLSVNEVGIAGLYKTIAMKTGSFIHFGLVELSAVGAYEVHYVSKVSVRVVDEAAIPGQLREDVGKGLVAVKEHIEGELGSGVITFVDGIFGRSETQAVFTQHILPLQGLDPIPEEKAQPIPEKTDEAQASAEQKQEKDAAATGS